MNTGRVVIFIVSIVSQPQNPLLLYLSMADDIFCIIVSLIVSHENVLSLAVSPTIVILTGCLLMLTID